MIRFRCPKCDKKLAVSDARAGTSGVCPECKSKFRIPAAPVEDAIVSELPPVPSRESDDEEQRPRRKSRVQDIDDEESFQQEDIEERPLRKKRKKKRRKSGLELPLGLDVITLGAILAGVGGLLFVALTFVVPALAILPIGLGFAMSLAGGIWFLVLVFKDSVANGIICIFFGIYSIYLLINNFDELKRPFFIQLAGTIILLLGSCAGGMATSDALLSGGDRAENSRQNMHELQKEC